MKLKKNLGWTSEKIEDMEKIITTIVGKHPIELEDRIDTLSKPLILECACPGWQTKHWGPPQAYPEKKPPGYKEGDVRYPAVPCEIDEQAQTIIEAVKAGAAAVHIHPRDPGDCMAANDVQLLKQVYDKIFEKVDAISIQHTWERTEDGEVDYTSPLAQEILKIGKGGNKYCQGAVVLWPPADAFPPQYTEYVQEGIRFMEEHNIKPIHKLRSGYGVRQLKRVLIDTKIMTEKPYILVHDMGHPFGWPMDIDPWMPIELIISIVQTKQRLGDDCVIGVFSGGRNWMPITMTAILAGVDFVRVGIEDCYWMYPHRDEVIQRNIDAVKKIIDFCNIIGRKIASVEESRRILGIRRLDN